MSDVPEWLVILAIVGGCALFILGYWTCDAARKRKAKIDRLFEEKMTNEHRLRRVEIEIAGLKAGRPAS